MKNNGVASGIIGAETLAEVSDLPYTQGSVSYQQPNLQLVLKNLRANAQTPHNGFSKPLPVSGVTSIDSVANTPLDVTSFPEAKFRSPFSIDYTAHEGGIPTEPAMVPSLEDNEKVKKAFSETYTGEISFFYNTNGAEPGNGRKPYMEVRVSGKALPLAQGFPSLEFRQKATGNVGTIHYAPKSQLAIFKMESGNPVEKTADAKAYQG